MKYNTDWTKIPELCPHCVAKLKANQKTTHCKECGTSIKYDSSKRSAPSLCKGCFEKRKSETLIAKCRTCGDDIYYKINSPHVPTMCRKCKEKIGANKSIGTVDGNPAVIKEWPDGKIDIYTDFECDKHAHIVVWDGENVEYFRDKDGNVIVDGSSDSPYGD